MLQTFYNYFSSIPPTVIGAIVTVIVGFLINKNSANRDFALKRETADLNRRIAQDSVELKTREAKTLATYKYTDILVKRHFDIQKDISALITMLDMYESGTGPFEKDVQEKAYNLCSSISFQMFPAGDFSEEFIVQLGHIRGFFSIGKSYWQTKANFYSSFKANCWMMLNEDLRVIEKSIIDGSLVERRNIEPRKITILLN